MTRILIITLVLAVMAAPLAARDPAARLHVTAQEAIQQHHYAEAQRLLQLLLDGDPENVDYLRDLVDAQSRSGNPDEAGRSLKRWLEIEPDNEAVAVRLARIQIQEQQWSEIISYLPRFAAGTRSAELCRLLGQAYRRLDFVAEASWYYEKALDLEPGTIGDLAALSELQLIRDQAPLAIRLLEDALEQQPGTGLLHYHLARAYLRAGVPLGNVDVRPLADALPNRTSGPWFVIEALPENPNRYRVSPRKSAIYHLHKAFESGLQLPAMHLLSADIWHAAGDHERARQLYETLEAAVPNEDRAGYHYRYGITLYWLDDLTGFEQHLQRALDLDPDAIGPHLAESYVMLADRHCIRGNRTSYIRFLELAVAHDAGAVEPRYKLGNALLESNRPDEAAAQYRAVLQLQPHHPDRDRILHVLGAPPTEPRPSGSDQ